MTLETISIEFTFRIIQIIKQVGNAQFQIPTNLTLNTTNNSSISHYELVFCFRFFLINCISLLLL